MLSEVVTCNCVRNPGTHAESNQRPSEEGVSFYHVLRPLDQKSVGGGGVLLERGMPVALPHAPQGMVMALVY